LRNEYELTLPETFTPKFIGKTVNFVY